MPLQVSDKLLSEALCYRDGSFYFTATMGKTCISLRMNFLDDTHVHSSPSIAGYSGAFPLAK